MARHARLTGLLGIGALCFAGTAGAEWPVSRHDAQRTALAGGSCDIGKPTKYWQRYLGGTLRGDTHLALDVDGDGQKEVVYLAGGKVIAKLPDDRLLWESTPVELTQIHGIVDLDSDGQLEVVASSPRNVFVVSGKSGAILWKSPDGEVGNVGGVRLADLDGDKTIEIVIDDCACCGVSPTASPAGGVYKFAAGKLATPTKLYAPLSRSHCGAQATTIGDFDGDGAADVAYGQATGYTLTTGKTGATLGVSDPAGETMYYASCETANFDGRIGDDLVCFQNSYLATVGGGRRVAAFTYDPAAPTKVRTLWNLAPVPKATGELRWVGNSLGDLDGDGKVEVVFASRDGTGPWTTTVIDAKTGTELAKTAGKLVGLLDVDGDKKAELLTEPDGGVGVTITKFDRAATPAVSAFATLTKDLKVPYGTDWARLARSTVGGKPLLIDLEGDGKIRPIFFQRAAAGASAAYGAYVFDAAGAATVKASYSVPDDVSILTNEVFVNVNRGYPQLLVTRNDGYLVVLDSAFSPTNGISYGTGEFKTTLPGMRVGGFLAEPIAPRLDGTADSPIVRDSRGVLVRVDPSGAWMSKPPTLAWEVRDAGSPTTAAGIDGGKPGLACVKADPVTRQPDTLLALSAAGTKLWERKMPEGTLTFDPLAGDVNSDGVKDLFVAWVAPGAVLKMQVHDGKTGAPIWATPHAEALSWGFQPFAVADWNGDGVADAYTVPNTLRVLSGASGAKLAENTTFLAYFTPVIADVDGDGKQDVTLSRGYFPARTLANDLVTQKWIGADDRPYPHGARGACGARSVWVQPSSQFQGMVRLIDMNGGTVGTAKTLYLAGGKVFASAADAATDKKFLGTVGHVAVKQELMAGAGHPSALMGSSDGFLYAINPCDGALDWSFDLRFAVGDPILADTSGDGVDEILVPAADGYLHAIGQRLLPAPASANDNDPFGAVPGPDVDTVKTKDTLAVSWPAVPGADGYQVAIVTEGGSYVTQPDWVDVGAATDVKLKSLGLVNGRKYFAAVRAASKTKGASLETRSNGVVVEIVETPDAGAPDGPLFDDTGTPPVDAASDTGTDAGALADATPTSGGCGCRAVAGGKEGAALSALALALALARRRRPRPTEK